jgi:hypothetical protein
MSFYIFLKKMTEFNLEILQMVRNIHFFGVLLQFYLIIQKIKAKLLIDENKYVCGYCKII